MPNLKLKFNFQRKMAIIEEAKAEKVSFASDGELDVVGSVVDVVGSVVEAVGPVVGVAEQSQSKLSRVPFTLC